MSAEEKQKTNKTRLVLGERQAVLQETRQHGGVYIDPNPGVLQTLQQANIDPYIIYEQALKQQIDAKIGRIDFVRADVDELFEEWKDKPHLQAPIHVRLLIWLENNAGSYGYEQQGNSWVLK